MNWLEPQPVPSSIAAIGSQAGVARRYPSSYVLPMSSMIDPGTLAHRVRSLNPVALYCAHARQGLRKQDCALARALECRRALDAADRPRRVLRRAALQRLPGPPRHPQGGPLRPARGARRRDILERPRSAARRSLSVRADAGRARPVAALNALLAWGGRHRHPAAACSARRLRHAPRRRRLLRHASSPRRLEDIVTEPAARPAPRRKDPVAVALQAPHRLLEPLET